MKTAVIFPGQGAQMVGMGKSLYETNEEARILMDKADEILGFSLTKIMFEGPEEELKRTSVTQPAIFLHSVALAMALNISDKVNASAGHSLGEFSALVVSGAISFEDGLKLVSARANAMQMACDLEKSTMGAIVGLENEVVEELCKEIGTSVVPANYNTKGQLVISGSEEGVQKALVLAKEKGARLAKELQVNGAFHSPFMEPAAIELKKAIDATEFKEPTFPIYQNVNAEPVNSIEQLKNNLIAQLTAPVKWTQIMKKMQEDGFTDFIELGPGKVLSGLFKRFDRALKVESFQEIPVTNENN